MTNPTESAGERSATPRTDAYPCKLVERTIDEALHPKGMSVHDGKVALACDHVQRIIAISRTLERDLTAARQRIEGLEKSLGLADDGWELQMKRAELAESRLSAAEQRAEAMGRDAASEQRWANQYAKKVGELTAALEKISNTALSHPYAGVTCGEMARAALAQSTEQTTEKEK